MSRLDEVRKYHQGIVDEYNIVERNEVIASIYINHCGYLLSLIDEMKEALEKITRYGDAPNFMHRNYSNDMIKTAHEALTKLEE